jgi:hypothetical protein
MSSALKYLCLTLSGLALTACAYAPEAAEPSWTDAQLAANPPGETPVFVPEERLNVLINPGIDIRSRRLVLRRDEVRAAGAAIPEPDGRAEDFAAQARERGTPPDPN